MRRTVINANLLAFNVVPFLADARALAVELGEPVAVLRVVTTGEVFIGPASDVAEILGTTTATVNEAVVSVK